MRQNGCYGIILVAVILVSCVGMAVIGVSLISGNPGLQPHNTASTRCIGLINIGSCNITQTSHRPSQDSNSNNVWAGLLALAVVATVFMASRSGGDG